MKYSALLRGINVGGNSMVNMQELKRVFTDAGFSNVSTYINSGNVLFESEKNNIEQLTRTIEHLLEKHFFLIKTIVISDQQLKNVVKHIPQNWEKEDLQKYIAFIRAPFTPDDVIKEVQLKGVDDIEKGPGVVYMSTKMSGITQSNFSKLNAKPIYKEMTIRNYTTVQKLLELMK